MFTSKLILASFFVAGNQTREVKRGKTFAQSAKYVYCTNVPVVARYAVPSLAACSIKCLATTDCAFFIFGKRIDDVSGPDLYYCDVSGPYNSNVTLTTSVGTDWSTYILE